MIKKMFKMQLLPGFKEEYEKRHPLLWPEMREARSACRQSHLG